MQVMMNESKALLKVPGAWQALAVEEYEQSFPERRAAMRASLATRVFTLTGCWIPHEDIYTEERLAAAGVDGVTFRLYREDVLVLVRPCAYCGTGRFESPELSSRADLGHALSDWRPTHEDCEDFSSEDLADW